jgi:glycine dehydrogenase subunit 2
MSENGGVLRPFHQASWNEPIVLEQSSPGERGILLPEPEPDVAAAGDGLADLPAELRRTDPPGLPELSQPQVLRHFLRLSQETLGIDVDIHLGAGTCTMKYSPKVNEELVRSHKVTELHPEQDRGSSRRCGASSARSARSPAWTGSPSSRPADHRPSTRTPP